MNTQSLRQAVRVKLRNRIIVFLLVTLGGYLAFFTPSSTLSTQTAYVDEALLGSANEKVSVIVTAVSTDTAVAAIQSVGGQVTSDLWLIDAAGAVIEPSQLTQLAAYPGIVSIVDNKGLETAQVSDSAYQWEGWVTDRRNYVNSHELSGDMWFAPIVLPDGAVFAMIEKGDALILEMNGDLRASFTLGGKPFRSAPAIDADGTIYVAGKTKIHAVSPLDGAPIWSTNAIIDKFEGGLALGSDAVFVMDASDKLMAYDKTDGQNLWKTTLPLTIFDDKVTAAPTVGPDGTVYIISEAGQLLALNPANGGILWTYVAPDGADFLLQPQVDVNGVIYLAGKDAAIAVNPNGTQKYFQRVTGQILAQPILNADSSIFVPTDAGYLYGLTAAGSEIFTYIVPGGAKFQSTPALSLDESVIYVTSKGAQMLAINTSDGSLLWEYATVDGIVASPVIAENGNIHVGDKGGHYLILRPDGVIVYRYNGFNQFLVSPTISQDGSVFFHNNKATIEVLARRPLDWSDQVPHVESTTNPNVYKVASPLSIDLGADVAHDNGVTGTGIGVAVIDSGVYFDQHTQDTLGANVQNHFLGQADFVGAITCTDTMTMTIGGSPSACFTDYTNSQDGFGHGSHVAGIIWNNVQDYYTGAVLGIAPDANVLSVRVLNDDGMGTYEDVIEGIQYVVANKDVFDIRVMNMSLSAHATTPYFVDPMNRAVEAAWAEGIVVVAAAGNEGPQAETITVPGNDPYVITVGAVDSKRTPGYWADDTIRDFSSTGPTLDGFVKPDVIAPGGNIVSYMYNDGDTNPTTSNSPKLVLNHPDYSVSGSMFRMNGTSMSTAVASGVVALMLDADPALTPDQVKYRLLYTARTVVSEDDDVMMSVLQQGVGRIWVPDTLFADLPLESANTDMDIDADLAHGWLLLDGDGNPVLDVNGEPVLDETELDFHYIGPVQRILSDDGLTYLYFVEDPDDNTLIEPLGIARVADNQWLDTSGLDLTNPTYNGGGIIWDNGYIFSGGRYSWAGGRYSWAGGRYSWAGGRYSWAGGRYSWAGGRYSWAGGRYSWAGGRYSWAGGRYSWAGGRYSWAGGTPWLDAVAQTTSVSSTTWIDDEITSPTAVSLQKIEVTSQTSWLTGGFVMLFILSVISLGLNRPRKRP